ncbi:cation diffusion facilitator family transporter [Microvirga antarctica]|uniref:cation diffusion facilitator family transporter n=1 Tax=Microvirga antarctica TaxID=2819233 RepID=UPI001B30E07E|nr:cation diffusion facilitator family transporter [Microvirga antarctica]
MSAHHHSGHSPHGHAHAPPAGHGRAFIIGIVLNLAFVGIEATYGFLADSMALLSDAGHNLSDVLGLAIAGGAAVLARRGPSERFTYGLRSGTILAALFNALLLLVAVGGIVWESIDRLLNPAPVAAVTVMIVAGVGILINGFTAWLFVRGRKDDINIQGAFLHMAADAVVSLGVVLAGGVILLTGLTIIDPLISLVIAGVIVWTTWDLLRQSLTLSLQGVPATVSVPAVRQALETLPGVARVHHLHVWAVSTTETALTCHLVMPDGHPGNGFLARTQADLKKQFGIGHATLQIEIGSEPSPRPPEACPLEASAAVSHDHDRGTPHKH